MTDVQPDNPPTHSFVDNGEGKPMLADTRIPRPSEQQQAFDPPPPVQDKVQDDNFTKAVRGSEPPTLELGGQHYRCVEHLNPLALADWQILLAEIATVAGSDEAEIKRDPEKTLKLVKTQKELLLMVEWVVSDDDWPDLKARLYDKNGGIPLPELAGALGQVVGKYTGMSQTKR